MNSTVFPWKMLAITASALTILFIGGFLISGNQPVQSKQTIAHVYNTTPAASPVAHTPTVIDSPKHSAEKNVFVTAEKKQKPAHKIKASVTTQTTSSTTDTAALIKTDKAQTGATLDEGPTPLNEMLVMDMTSPKKPAGSNIHENEAHPKAGWDNFEKYLSIEAIVPNGKPGTVKLSFTVGNDGSLSNFKIKSTLNTVADKKAIELVKNGPTWAGNANKQASETNVTIDFH